jgi:hypothetical protein
MHFPFAEFLIALLAKLTASAIEKVALVITRTGLPVPLRVHTRELREKLAEMPFIYKDVDSDVLTDFVDIDIQALNLDELQPQPVPRVDIGMDQRIRSRKKAILLGNAGIGKTTFIRHTILSLIEGENLSIFHDGERFVPFYVPLKAVDNTAPRPVVRYLLDNNSYLSGRRGAARLERLARAQRVMLFLDGYDEIYLDLGRTGQANYIREDLNWLVGKVSDHGHDDYLAKLYAALTSCRVWLSSRREFYASNQLDLSRVYNSAQYPLDCVGLGLLGVGNSRMQLVRKIFDKYRSRSKIFCDLLSEELFLQQVDRSGNEELRSLSENPLFLTVMCYVYVDRALEADEPGVAWASNTSDLVMRCVSLLLRDLDEYKARGLPTAQRVALTRRRNAFEDEKRQFLPFFAWSLLEERRNVFSVSYVNQRAVMFFKANSQYKSSSAILDAIARNDESAETIGAQLANQGIFVVAEKVATRITFDFAHRRFKEFLAARYLEGRGDLAQLLTVVDREDLGEFTLVLMRESSHRLVVFDRILELALASERQDYYARLASSCASLQIEKFDPSQMLSSFLMRALTSDTEPRLTRAMIDRANATGDLLTTAVGALDRGLRGRERWRAGVAAEILFAHEPAELANRLDLAFDTLEYSHPFFLDALHYAYVLRPQLLLKHVARLSVNPETFLAFAHVVATKTSTLDDSFDFAMRTLEAIPARFQPTMIASMYVNNPAAFAAAARRGWKSEELEATAHIVRFAATQPMAWLSAKQLKSDILVGTEIGAANAGTRVSGDFRRDYLGKVFSEADLPPSAGGQVAGHEYRNGLTRVSPAGLASIAAGISLEETARRERRVPRRVDFDFVVA